MPYYAVANGRNIGIFSNWNDCNNSVNKFKNALYKKFDTKEEAENFIANSSEFSNKPIDKNKYTTKNNIQKQNNMMLFFDTNESKQEDIDIFNPDYVFIIE